MKFRRVTLGNPHEKGKDSLRQVGGSRWNWDRKRRVGGGGHVEEDKPENDHFESSHHKPEWEPLWVKRAVPGGDKAMRDRSYVGGKSQARSWEGSMGSL